MFLEDVAKLDGAVDKTRQSTRICTCPNCHTQGVFTSSGEQHWPPQIAEARGIPTRVTLWKCATCHTNVNELQLKKQSVTIASAG